MRASNSWSESSQLSSLLRAWRLYPYRTLLIAGRSLFGSGTTPVGIHPQLLVLPLLSEVRGPLQRLPHSHLPWTMSPLPLRPKSLAIPSTSSTVIFPSLSPTGEYPLALRHLGQQSTLPFFRLQPTTVTTSPHRLQLPPHDPRWQSHWPASCDSCRPLPPPRASRRWWWESGTPAKRPAP